MLIENDDFIVFPMALVVVDVLIFIFTRLQGQYKSERKNLLLIILNADFWGLEVQYASRL